MHRKPNFSFKIRFPEFLLAAFILGSGVLLAFNSGSFVLNFKQIGFSVFSSMEKGVHFVTDGVKNTFNAVGELRKLKKDYNELVIKLENYEEMQRSNADIRKENARLKSSLIFLFRLMKKIYHHKLLHAIWITPSAI